MDPKDLTSELVSTPSVSFKSASAGANAPACNTADARVSCWELGIFEELPGLRLRGRLLGPLEVVLLRSNCTTLGVLFGKIGGPGSLLNHLSHVYNRFRLGRPRRPLLAKRTPAQYPVEIPEQSQAKAASERETTSVYDFDT